MPGTPRPDYVSTKRQRIAELARNCPDMAFTNLVVHFRNNCGVSRDALCRPGAISRPRPKTASLAWRLAVSGKPAERHDRISNQTGAAHDC